MSSFWPILRLLIRSWNFTQSINDDKHAFVFEFFWCRFPKLFPPLNPEMVAHRTVDAVRTDTAYVVLPWTMHFLVILKRWGCWISALQKQHTRWGSETTRENVNSAWVKSPIRQIHLNLGTSQVLFWSLTRFEVSVFHVVSDFLTSLYYF